MVWEKPIRTIRNAVKGAAEELASKEGIEKPEEKHYEAVFSTLKKIRNYSPEMTEAAITALARSKKLKDNLGRERAQVFEQVVYEISEELKNDKKKDFFEKFDSRLRTDPRIISAFSGKENLLSEALEYIKQEFPKLLSIKSTKEN